MVGLDEVADIMRFATILGVLSLAAVSDFRTRKVSNVHWVAICAVCIPLGAVSLSIANITSSLCYLTGSGILAVYMLSPRIIGYAAGAIMLLSACVLCIPLLMGLPGKGVPFETLLFFILLLAMYHKGILAGGADVKCLMTLALTFPLPVNFLMFPLIENDLYVIGTILPILVVALFLCLPNMMRLAVTNLLCGRRRVDMLMSTPVPVDGIDLAFECPVQSLKDGELRMTYVSIRKAPMVLQELKDEGVETVEVTPTSPFIVQLTVAFATVILVGNPLCLIF